MRAKATFALMLLVASSGPRFARADVSLLRIDEIAVACANGDSSVQFIELVAVGPGQLFASALTLRIEDRFGTVRLEQANLFPSVKETQWTEGRRWLLGSAKFSALGVAADDTIGPSLDLYGGRVSLLVPDAGGYRLIHEVVYGAPGSVDAPLAGRSLQRQPDDSFAEKSPPDPTNSAGTTATGRLCSCPKSYFQFCESPAVPSTSPVASQGQACGDRYNYRGWGSARYDLPNGTVHAEAEGRCETGANVLVQADDVYYVVGPAAGTPVSFTANCHVLLSAFATGDCHYASGDASTSISIGASTRSWGVGDRSSPGDTVLQLEVTAAAHQPFNLSMSCVAGGAGGGGASNGSLFFLDLPSGAYVVSCQGYTSGQPHGLPVSITLASSVNPWMEGRTVTLTASVTPAAAGGTISFFDSGRLFATVPMVGGVATTPYKLPAGGSRRLSSVYNGDSTYSPGGTFLIQQIVPRISTTLSLSSSQNPWLVGRTITVMAAIQPRDASGAVDLLESGIRIGTAILVNGLATWPYVLPQNPGERRLSVSYTGDTLHAGSSASIIQRVVELFPTTTALLSSQNPALVGQAITLSARVQPGMDGPPAMGTVDLLDSGLRFATLALVNGSAALQYVLPAAAGDRTLRASYSGDSAHALSSDSLVEHVFVRFPTAITMSSSANPSTRLDVTLRAEVSPAPGGGAVEFSDDSGPIATAPLANGVATIAYHAPRFSAQTMTASYAGDSIHVPSTTTLLQSFAGRPTATLMTSSVNPVTIDQPFTLRATVQPDSATGTVSFYDAGALIGSAPLAGGVAILPWQLPRAGLEKMSGTYSGDTTYSASAGQLDLEVAGLSLTITLTSSANPTVEASVIEFTAAIGPAVVAGDVSFWVDHVLHSTVAMRAGAAAFTIANLAAGAHRVTAQYSGGPRYQTSYSNVITQLVMPVTGSLLRVLAPNHGETWTVGSPAEIRWDASNSGGVSRVSLYLSRTRSPVWELIAMDAPNTGSYVWTVTGPGTNIGPTTVDAALVSVIDHSGRVNSDMSDLPFSIVDLATPTLVTRFEAEPIENGVRVSWELSSGSMNPSVVLQRAPAETGPWLSVAAAAHAEGGRMIAQDATAEAGLTYWYRLTATLAGETQAVIGPIKVVAGGTRKYLLGAAHPNPTRGPLTLEFAVPGPSHVSLSVIDLQGREISVLADGTYGPGRYQVHWDGRSERRPVPPGLYFLRLRSPDGAIVTRVVVSP